MALEVCLLGTGFLSEGDWVLVSLRECEGPSKAISLGRILIADYGVLSELLCQGD